MTIIWQWFSDNKIPYLLSINMQSKTLFIGLLNLEVALARSKSKDSRIGEFVLRLQEDYKLLDEFKKHPDKVMKDAGIKSKEIRNILKSGDLLRIEGLLNETNQFT